MKLKYANSSIYSVKGGSWYDTDSTYAFHTNINSNNKTSTIDIMNFMRSNRYILII